jgi:hypothetical protein
MKSQNIIYIYIHTHIHTINTRTHECVRMFIYTAMQMKNTQDFLSNMITFVATNA